MILITGGAGFIGSVLQAALARMGQATIVADRLRDNGKWRNLASHPPDEIVPPEALEAWLNTAPNLDAVVHLGAVSATTATNGDHTWASNVALSQHLWRWCASHAVPLIYASSAATYGDGSAGFDDDATLAHLLRLRPLNLYGWTKHAFDLWVARQVANSAAVPPFWAGLKFFNVYGPNEYHKGSMISVVKVKHDEVAQGLPPRLFRADRPDLADGQQRRDFIWIDDVVDVMLWLLRGPHPGSSLYNLGTGRARSYLDLAYAVCHANEVAAAVEYIPMPQSLVGQYQNFTEARIDRLRAAGYAREFTSLEEGVTRYVRDYLRGPTPYR